MLLILSAASVFVLYPIINKPTVLLHKARELAQTGQTAEADRLLLRAVEEGLRRPLPVLRAAEMLLGQGQADKAAALVDETMQSMRTVPAGMARRMAGLFDAHGRPAQALGIMLSTRDTLGRDEQLYLADLLRRQERYDESLALYVDLLKDDPADPEAALRRVETLTWMGNLEAALQPARDLVREQPDNRAARLLLARILAWTGRVDEAETQYRRLLGELP